MKKSKSLRSVINYSAMATTSSNRGKWNHQKVYGTTENADAIETVAEEYSKSSDLK